MYNNNVLTAIIEQYNSDISVVTVPTMHYTSIQYTMIYAKSPPSSDKHCWNSVESMKGSE